MGPRIPDWSEDGCLTVNVWVPKEISDTPRPVLLWFHGGGFTSGSGGWDWYDGARLATLGGTGGIIVVTANYRLGPLGYLQLPGVDNLGCQDQIAALGWVAENIAAFGGDPGMITVGGQSAGAFSALALALDPATSSLVRRVIGQSGPLGLPPLDPDEAVETTARYLELLDIPAGGDPLPRLRAVPTLDLLYAYARLMIETAAPGRVAPPLYPVLGGAGQPGDWRELVPAGDLSGKDVLMGMTSDEATPFVGLNPMIQTMTTQAAQELLGGLDGEYGAARYRRFAAEHPGARPGQVLTAALGELIFGDDLLTLGVELAGQGAPAYIYRFTRGPAADPFGLGAAHCADLPFLFGNLDSFPNAPMLGAVTASDHALAAQFGGALAAFVATGSPNGPGLEPWKPWLPGHSPDVRVF
jgi:para-nitrobenzyl esterase